MEWILGVLLLLVVIYFISQSRLLGQNATPKSVPENVSKVLVPKVPKIVPQGPALAPKAPKSVPKASKIVPKVKILPKAPKIVPKVNIVPKAPKMVPKVKIVPKGPKAPPQINTKVAAKITPPSATTKTVTKVPTTNPLFKTTSVADRRVKVTQITVPSYAKSATAVVPKYLPVVAKEQMSYYAKQHRPGFQVKTVHTPGEVLKRF